MPLSHPVTSARIEQDLRRLGLEARQTVLVHTSLSRLGWVVGGPVGVVLALERVLTPSGTLVMPAFTTQHSDPSLWTAPPVPEAWWPAIRAHMPGYLPDLTPTREMGAVAECFRSQDGVVRSDHPRVSFAAWGRRARHVARGHELDYELGEGSPLARLYELGAHVLFLGTGYDTCTAFHLAEYRADWPGKQLRERGVPLASAPGTSAWHVYPDVRTDDRDFPRLGADFEAQTGLVRTGPVGAGTGRLFPFRDAVDFAAAWLPLHRPAPAGDGVTEGAPALSAQPSARGASGERRTI